MVIGIESIMIMGVEFNDVYFGCPVLSDFQVGTEMVVAGDKRVGFWFDKRVGFWFDKRVRFWFDKRVRFWF